MGIVYEAFDAELNRRVALKLLSTAAATTPQVDRFLFEARTVAALNNPHIVQVFGVGKHDDQPYFAMELVEGRELEAILGDPEHPLTIAEGVAIVIACVRALVAAQDHGIVHRDIKPANIMISRQGVVKVMDFGLAKAGSLSTSLTTEGQILGTPDYISPEQASGGQVDTRSDMYSLGCVLYRCLTGRKPFVAETPMEVICCHVLHEPEPIRTLNPAVPFALSSINERMMAKDPELRFSSQRELLEALENFLTQIADYKLPGQELAVDLAWHAQDPTGRTARKLKLQRKTVAAGPSRMLVGQLLKISGASTSAPRTVDRGLTAQELASRADQRYRHAGFGLLHLVGLLALAGLLGGGGYLAWRSGQAAGSEAEVAQFRYQPEKLHRHLPEGWTLERVARHGEALDLHEGRLLESGVYELSFRGPEGRAVTTTVSWSADGIVPAPAPDLFAPVQAGDSSGPAPSQPAAPADPRTPRTGVAAGRLSADAAGWTNGVREDWGGRSGVRVALGTPVSPAGLRCNLESLGLLKIESGGSLKLDVRLKGATRITLQLYCPDRGEVFCATREVAPEKWVSLAWTWTEFKSLGGDQRLATGDLISQIGVFSVVEDGASAEDLRAGTQIGVADCVWGILGAYMPQKCRNLGMEWAYSGSLDGLGLH